MSGVSGSFEAPEEVGEALVRQVLEPMKQRFVDKDEVIDLLGVCLIGGENLFLFGPPGTAKSALVRALSQQLDGHSFEALLTRFTEPSEIFGPFDIRRLREGELVTNTDGMLPEATLVFLDELLNANSAILNSLLTVLNERVYRRGRENVALPTLMVVAASNRLPEDDTLQALYDRFLLRADCGSVVTERLATLLEAGWQLEFANETNGVSASASAEPLRVEHIRAAQSRLGEVDLSAIRGPYVALVGDLRRAGIELSDRRVVKLQRLIAASALLCGRRHAEVSDLWILRHTWDRVEQQQVVRSLVAESLREGGQDSPAETQHPRAIADEQIDAEVLARDVESLQRVWRAAAGDRVTRAQTRDQLSGLAARCDWVEDQSTRQALADQIGALWRELE